MAVREIILWPHSALRRVSEPVPESAFGTPEFRELWIDLLDTCRQAPGYGLSAIQIGVPLRVFVAMGVRQRNTVLVNPTWVPADDDPPRRVVEGCLSLPMITEKVARHRHVICSYTDESGCRWEDRTSDLDRTGLLAQVIQHECEHLDGKFFLDNSTPTVRERARSRMRKMHWRP